jgi:hypothetical protein
MAAQSRAKSAVAINDTGRTEMASASGSFRLRNCQGAGFFLAGYRAISAK